MKRGMYVSRRSTSCRNPLMGPSLLCYAATTGGRSPNVFALAESGLKLIREIVADAKALTKAS